MYSNHHHAYAEIVAGKGVINSVSFKRSKVQVQLTVEEEVTLRIAQRRYPYSRAMALPQHQELALTGGETDGLVSLQVPAGTSVIEITPATTPAKRWGQVLGTAALVMLVGGNLIKRRIKRLPGRWQ
jgi:hypothetical protein